MSRNHSSCEFFIIYSIYFFVEDVDIKYMSIYKEENNKKDCFEHLISLQDCGHNRHATTDCATREQDGDKRAAPLRVRQDKKNPAVE